MINNFDNSSFDQTKISFRNVKSDKIKQCFYDAVERYTPLHGNPIHLHQRNLKSTTMQAQPMINGDIFAQNKRQYRVDCAFVIKTKIPVKIESLPSKVLVGWFAHELGHLVDYHFRSTLSLFSLGIGYLVSEKIKKEAEKQADLYAIEYGFSQEILATKRFILEHNDISTGYKSQIQKYYMSPEEVEALIKEKDQSLLDLDDAQII